MDFGLENQESSWKSCGWNMCCFRVCFFTALEWILGGFGEVLSILGGCQEVPKLVQKRIRAEILFFDRAGAFWVAFWRGFGSALAGFWKGLAEFLECLGASWTLGAPWVAFSIFGLHFTGFCCVGWLWVAFWCVCQFLVAFCCICWTIQCKRAQQL